MSDSLAEVLTDVTIREGSQQKSDLWGVGSQKKLEIVRLQKAVGIKSIELTAFAPGEWFADADELAEGVKGCCGKMVVKALYFNVRGAERLQRYPYLQQAGIVHTAVTEGYRIKNYNQQSIDDALLKLRGFVEWFSSNGFTFDVLLFSTSWGDKSTGILDSATSMRCIEKFMNEAERCGSLPTQITLADTEGVVDPRSLSELVQQVKRAFPEQKICLHLHPSREAAVAVVEAGLEAEADLWEGAWLGIGGSPLADGAGGNLDIRTLVEVYQQNGIPTGFDPVQIESLEKRIAEIRSPQKK
ncbi:MAG: hypothetical protein KDD70_00095 [Bdellovibrionales bacterium]|nr:hypothetical protein [Bdellovibrionales bacterium]